MNKQNIILTTLTLIIFTCLLYIIYVTHQNTQLKDKVQFYERVITDFGIEEFIDYPELYYNTDYVDQAQVHQCMWAISDMLDCENKYQDLLDTLK